MMDSESKQGKTRKKQPTKKAAVRGKGNSAQVRLGEGLQEITRVLAGSPLASTLASRKDGQFAWVNDSFCRFLGLAEDEIVNRTPGELGLWTDPSREEEIAELLAARGQVSGMDLAVNARGEVRRCLFSSQTVEQEGQSLALGTWVELFPSRGLLDPSFDQDVRHSNLLFGAPAGIAEMDSATGRILYVNDTLCRILGYEAQELSEMSFSDLLEEKSKKAFEQSRAALAGGKATEFSGEFGAVTRSQAKIWLEVLLNAVYEKRQAVRLRVVALDATGRVEAAQELRKKEKILEGKAHELMEVNEALRSLLRQAQTDADRTEQRVVANVEDFVIPYVTRLRGTPMDTDQHTYLNVIESNLREIISPFMRRAGSRHPNLTLREIEVANLVRMGKTSKEISRLLNIPRRTADFHRDSLRRKLGLKKTRQNLRAFLASMT